MKGSFAGDGHTWPPSPMSDRSEAPSAVDTARPSGPSGWIGPDGSGIEQS